MVYNIRWGIIGPGHIAEKFASDLRYAEGAKLVAIASRDQQRANDFATRFNVPVAYGSYAEIVKDPDVDIIYIATPHSLHCENTLLCLDKGKAVLCEKPFAINARQAESMIRTAQRNGLFLMEAMWTRFNPVIMHIKDFLMSGALGQIKFIRADFGFSLPPNPEGRVFNPQLGGGSLLDVGVYPLFLAQLLLGKPEEIKAIAQLSGQKVDDSTSMILKYRNGALSLLSSSVIACTEQEAHISCEKGRIAIPRFWYRPKKALILENDKPERWINEEFEGWGYQFQAMEANRCLREEKAESPLMTHDFSLTLMQTMDEIRKQCNIIYPFE